MNTNRRAFLKSSVAAGIAARAATRTSVTAEAQAALRPMTDGVVPITDDERRARIAKAQKLMADAEARRDLHGRHDELLLLHRHALGPERAHVRRRHSAEGEHRYVCPGFEEDRARELIKRVRRRSARLAGGREPVRA